MCTANAGWSWKLVVDCFPWVGSLLLTRGPMFVWCERFSSRCYLSWMWAKWVGKIRFAGSACVEWFDVSESLLCAKCAKLFAIAIMPKICWNVGLSDLSMSVCACAVYGEQYKNTLSPSIADSLQANAHTNALTNEKLLPVWKITNGKIDIENDFLKMATKITKFTSLCRLQKIPNLYVAFRQFFLLHSRLFLSRCSTFFFLYC